MSDMIILITSYTVELMVFPLNSFFLLIFARKKKYFHFPKMNTLLKLLTLELTFSIPLNSNNNLITNRQ